MYSKEKIQREVEGRREELFELYRKDRPSTWSCCSRTEEVICLGEWLRRELINLQLDPLGRSQQEGIFHRESRSQDDLYVLVAQIMNDTVDGKIDRERKPLRRWG